VTRPPLRSNREVSVEDDGGYAGSSHGGVARSPQISAGCTVGLDLGQPGDRFLFGVDPLTFNAHIIETGTESFRLSSTKAKRGK
jgi:hypothetical protein